MSNLNPGETAALAVAWKTYEAAVAKARSALEATPRFRNNPADRAMAYHALSEAQAMAYNFAIAPRLDTPQVHSNAWFSYLYTLGGTSPDLRNGALFLDGRRTYKVTGRFGGLKLILMQVFSHLLGHPQSKMLTNADFSTFELEPDGSFVATLSATPQRKNWIPIDASSDYNFIFVRRIYADWYCDRGELDIAAVDGPIPQDDFDENAVARRIETAAFFLDFLINKWTIGVYDLYLATNGGRKNCVSAVPGESIARDFIGSPSTNYFFGIVELADDEALIIDSESPKAGYWSMQVMDVWSRPLNFVHRQSDVNMSRAVIDSDGRCRYVISAKDPGIPNWLDTMGRREGTITGRNYHSSAMPASPHTKLVKLAELRSHLPADTRHVTPEQRSAALEYRTRGYAKMYGY
jgi:hypothetical protein